MLRYITLDQIIFYHAMYVVYTTK